MAEVKDPKIKLFGRTIGVPEASPAAAESVEGSGEGSASQDSPCSVNSMSEDEDLGMEDRELNKHQSCQKHDDAKEESGTHPLISIKQEESKLPRPMAEASKAVSGDTDARAELTLKTEEDQSELGNSKEKVLRKPDKILPCPRCNSMETKFCYFNNYNVNQPRHFCKNCQRYWTAGGAMRNVPVGAGRRRNKNASASQIRQQPAPEAQQSTRVEFPSTICTNGTAPSFSSDTPLCESMVLVLNIADKTMRQDTRNGLHNPGEAVLSISSGSKENGCDYTSESLATAASSKDELGNNGMPELIPTCQSFTPSVPYFAGAPCSPHPWHSVQWSGAVSLPSFAPAGFPLPVYSTGPPYWGCAVPGAWNVPWLIPPTLSTPHGHTAPSSGPNSPTLGKHSRDDNNLKSGSQKDDGGKESIPENCLWVPKTLRIDHPGEAAKSSIWATLGIKNDGLDSTGGSSLFKAFQSPSKGDKKTGVESHVLETSAVLQANPAALSRSLSFHESS